MTWKLAGLFALCASLAFAHGGVKSQQVLKRMNGMSAIGVQMKALGAMAKGTTRFEAGAVDEALAKLEHEAGRIPDLFAEPAADPKSEARPEIWEAFEDFTKEAQGLEAVVSGAIGQVTSADDLARLMGEIGQTCRACHGAYRIAD